MAFHAEDSDEMPEPTYLHPVGACLDELGTVSIKEALDGDCRRPKRHEERHADRA